MAAGDGAASKRPRLMVVVTHPMTARWLMRGQLAHFRARGFEVAVVASPGPLLDEVAAEEAVRTFEVPMARELSPGRDLVALLRLLGVIRRFRPHVVNAGTPKAGLLGMLAARLLAVPVRIYTLRGLRLETARGLGRRVLALAERVTSACAHRVVCVSPSLRSRYLELGLARPAATVVLGAGSSNGVDVERLRPGAPGDQETEGLRLRLGIPAGAPVVGFVGRLTRDKGIVDLLAAFRESVLPAHPEARLLLVGEVEAGDALPAPERRALDQDSRVVRTGFVPDPAPYYRLMDVFAFPSRREGFPNGPLEAAASGLPVAAYAATGTVDAVRPGETGMLVPAGDRRALGAAIAEYLRDPDLRRRHGEAGRRLVTERFRREEVWEALEREVRGLLSEMTGPHSGASGTDRG